MKVTFSNKTQAEIAIAGHVGCGHSHSLNNQVQDDCPGLAVMLSLYKEAAPISLLVKRVTASSDGHLEVELESGGIGKAFACRGITPQEIKMMQGLIGKEAICTHTVVADIFGRFYGQGATEVPVALQTAVANAALASFKKNFPDKFHGAGEGLEGNCGELLGTMLEIDGIPIATLATVNATWGGIGPNEDLEGNSNLYDKGPLLRKLGMEYLPTIIIEAVVYNANSKGLTENTFFARGHDEDDNPFVVDSICKAAESLKLPLKRNDFGMKRMPGALAANTKKVGENIIRLGEIIRDADDCKLKVQTVAELNRYASQDAGGVTFMSSTLHQEIGGTGVLKTTCGVINLIVTEEYIKENIIPWLSPQMIADYVNLVKATALELYKVKDAANAHIKKG